MPWPTNRPHTWSMDQQTDAVRRDHIYQIAELVTHLLDARGYTGDAGLAPLVGGHVPGEYVQRGEPGGCASLGADGKVVSTQLPDLSASSSSPTVGLSGAARGRAGGVASLGALGRVPPGQLPGAWLYGPYGGPLSTSGLQISTAWTWTPAIGLQGGSTVAVIVSTGLGRLARVMSSLVWRVTDGPEYMYMPAIGSSAGDDRDAAIGLRGANLALGVSLQPHVSAPTGTPYLVGVYRMSDPR